jgi:excisionase family DNA binding protein
LSNRILLTAKKVSELTGLAVGTIYHLVSQKRIPFVRISMRCVRFRPPDLEGWLAAMVELPRCPAENAHTLAQHGGPSHGHNSESPCCRQWPTERLIPVGREHTNEDTTTPSAAAPTVSRFFRSSGFCYAESRNGQGKEGLRDPGHTRLSSNPQNRRSIEGKSRKV